MAYAVSATHYDASSLRRLWPGQLAIARRSGCANINVGRHGEHMSNVREDRALQPLVSASATHGLALRAAASAAVFILLGALCAVCHAAAPAVAGSASNADLTVDGRTWTPCAAEYGTCRFSGTRDVL